MVKMYLQGSAGESGFGGAGAPSRLEDEHLNALARAAVLILVHKICLGHVDGKNVFPTKRMRVLVWSRWRALWARADERIIVAMAAAAQPIISVEPKVRALPERSADRVHFKGIGVVDSKHLCDKVIRPLFGDLDRDPGWTCCDQVEKRFGPEPGNRRWGSHQRFRNKDCGLCLWNPEKHAQWSFIVHDSPDFQPNWRTQHGRFKRELVEAGRELTKILRHSGP